MTKEQLDGFLTQKNTKLTVAMQMIDANSNGVLFIVDEDKKLVGALSDGDIRRWLINGGSLDAEVCQMMKTNPYFLCKGEKDEAVVFMRQKSITAVPVLDEIEQVIDVRTLKEIFQVNAKEKMDAVSVIIMAGGKGTRLYPYTKILPKPLIPIGEVPIVERIMDSYAEYGITDFLMTVNYKKNMIQSYFTEAEKAYSIEYVEENMPLGTGGSLKLIKRSFDKPIIVANCDSLIRTDYSVLYKHHLESGNAITMVTSLKNDTIPYGVVYSNDLGELDHIDEKPVRSYLINTGMYVVNPELIELIPDNTMFHMTHLVEKAMKSGYKVGMYPVSEDSFLDMGEFAEMKRMEEKLNLQ